VADVAGSVGSGQISLSPPPSNAAVELRVGLSSGNAQLPPQSILRSDTGQVLGPEREAATLESLVEARDRLKPQLSAAAEPRFNQRFNSGLAEFISMEQQYQGRKEDGTDICAIRYVQGSGLFRITLPRDEHTDLYLVKDQIVALNELIRHKQRASALAEFNQGR